jgi:hypothetical protein
MAEIARPKLVRRKPVEEEVEPEDEDTVDEVEEVEEAPAPIRHKVVVPTVAKKSVATPAPVAKKVAKPVEPEPDDDEDYVEPDVAPTPKKAVVKAKPVVKAEDDGDEAPQPKVAVRKVDAVVLDNVLSNVMELLSAGQAVLITKMDESHWSIGPAGIGQTKAVTAAASGKLRGADFYAEVYTPEYVAFDEEWSNMTYSEKQAKAKKLGVTWQEDKSQQINLMRMVQAVRESMGISKYKSEYASSKARNAIRG